MTTGAQLTTFITSLNAEATIDPTLLASLVDNAKTIFEEERPWMVLRKVNTSLSLATSNTWETAKALTSITDFSRLQEGEPIRLFDGDNLIHYFYQVPFDRRLEYKDASGTFVFDDANNTLYFNGVIPFAGTLYISYIASSAEIDVTSASAVWTNFPSRFLPILGYYAIGIYKGAVDYDSINRQMLPANAAALGSLKNAAEKWDNERQLAAISVNDPTENYGHPRSGAINRNAS